MLDGYRLGDCWCVIVNLCFPSTPAALLASIQQAERSVCEEDDRQGQGKGEQGQYCVYSIIAASPPLASTFRVIRALVHVPGRFDSLISLRAQSSLLPACTTTYPHLTHCCCHPGTLESPWAGTPRDRAHSCLFNTMGSIFGCYPRLARGTPP